MYNDEGNAPVSRSHNPLALKGRAGKAMRNVNSPLQGAHGILGIGFPGRCPGLYQWAPSVLNKADRNGVSEPGSKPFLA